MVVSAVSCGCVFVGFGVSGLHESFVRVKIEIDAPTRGCGASFGANTRVDAAHHYHRAHARLDRDV